MSVDLVLDTSAYSHLRAGRAEVLDRLAAAAVVYLPSIVLGELEAGFRIGRRVEENRRMLEQFLEEPFTSVLSVDERVAREYGRLFAELRQAGTPIPMNDVWIAACTIEARAHLLTFDSDFARVPRLECSILSA